MAGRVLGFLGAECVHVESPNRVNSWRLNKERPNPVNFPGGQPGERPYRPVLPVQLAERQQAVLHPRPEDARKGAGSPDRLAAACDVVICNFRPGHAREARPGLRQPAAHVSPTSSSRRLPAFGLSGPLASYAALGPTMEMAAGHVEPDRLPGRTARRRQALPTSTRSAASTPPPPSSRRWCTASAPARASMSRCRRSRPRCSSSAPRSWPPPRPARPEPRRQPRADMRRRTMPFLPGARPGSSSPREDEVRNGRRCAMRWAGPTSSSDPRFASLAGRQAQRGRARRR